MTEIEKLALKECSNALSRAFKDVAYLDGVATNLPEDSALRTDEFKAKLYSVLDFVKTYKDLVDVSLEQAKEADKL